VASPINSSSCSILLESLHPRISLNSLGAPVSLSIPVSDCATLFHVACQSPGSSMCLPPSLSLSLSLSPGPTGPISRRQVGFSKSVCITNLRNGALLRRSSARSLHVALHTRVEKQKNERRERERERERGTAGHRFAAAKRWQKIFSKVTPEEGGRTRNYSRAAMIGCQSILRGSGKMRESHSKAANW